MSYSWPSDFAVTYFVHTNEFLLLEKSFFILRVPLWSFLCWITYISRGNLLIEIHIVSTFEWFLNFRGSSTERKVSEWPEQLGPFPFFFRILFSANINKPYKFLRVVEQNVVVNSPHGEYISFIEAYDLHGNSDKAGYASIIKGGVRTKSVTIHLESTRNEDLKYYVRVFGHF